MRSLLRDFFALSKRERNSLFALITILFLIILANQLLPFFVEEKRIDFERLESLQFQLDQDRLKAYEAFIAQNNFDPNTADSATLSKAGLPAFIVKNIHKYRSAGGVFERKEDLKKIYGFNSSLYNEVLPLVKIDTSIIRESKEGFSKNSALASREKSPHKSDKLKEQEFSFYLFNPNNATKNDWLNMGFSEKQVSIILNYRAAIGGFKEKQDLKNCYAIDENIYNQLAPFMEIPETEKESFSENTPDDNARDFVAKVDINTASFEELIAVSGIGKYRANQLLYFRDKLGGYRSIYQIKELKMFKEGVFEELKPKLTASSIELQKIPVNTISFKELIRHPYFDYALTKEIFRLRDELGVIKGQNDLYNITFATDSLIRQISPYLDYKN